MSDEDPVYPDRNEVEDLKAEARAAMAKKEPSRWVLFGSGVLVGVVVCGVAYVFIRKGGD